MNKNLPAFTLIELLVVIVIVGILSGISMAAFRNYQSKARLAAAQNFAKEATTILAAETMAQGLNLLANISFDGLDGNGDLPNLAGNAALPSGMNASSFFADTPHAGRSFYANSDLGYGDGFWVYLNGRVAIGDGYSISVWLKSDGSGDLWNISSASLVSSGVEDMRMGLNLNQCASCSNSELVGSFFVRANSGTDHNLEGPLLDSDDEDWHHLLGTYDNTTQEAKFYFDGSLVAVESIPDNSGFTNAATSGNSYSFGDKVYMENFQVYPVPLVGVKPNNGSEVITVSDGGDQYNLS